MDWSFAHLNNPLNHGSAAGVEYTLTISTSGGVCEEGAQDRRRMEERRKTNVFLTTF
jgi:hypothetical protein